ncbi:MAG: TspO/MBR family protein [Ferruginibacter sp.]
MLSENKTGSKWWQVAMEAVIISAIGGLSSMQSSKNDRKVYTNNLKQAPWAPPAWLFAPAWTINNFFLIKALKRIIHSDMDEKRKLLAQQVLIWIIFFSFNYIYFNKKSPVLAAAWTIGDAVLAISSFAAVCKKDKITASLYIPLMLWTAFASTLAGYQALNNPDPLLKTKALIR